MANRAIIYAIYPNKIQEEQCRKTFGCCRFVHNQMLTIQQERYKNGEKHLSKFQANTYCNQHLKKEYPFLKEVDKFALTHAVYHLEDALNILAGFQDTRVSIKRRSRIPPISQMGILP